jgi:nicotinamide mononucleotide adenylyltransferase
MHGKPEQVRPAEIAHERARCLFVFIGSARRSGTGENPQTPHEGERLTALW